MIGDDGWMRSLLATFVSVLAFAATASAVSADSFVDVTPGTMAFAVPAGVTSLSVSATGGAGGDLKNGAGTTLLPGGRGALVTGTVAVFPGEQLQLTVATDGGNANLSAGTNGGGGAPAGGTGGYSAGGGGGATRVLACQGILCPVAVIAAGGGGAGATGFVSGPPFPTLPGGSGGAAGVRGTDGTSYVVSGGSGGQPGTAAAAGTGGSGADAGGSGTGPAGGTGGNQTGMFTLHEGGGGGGEGVFGGGGGGSGASGMDGSLNQVYSGGGGGGGGASLIPTGGALKTAAPGAAPGIVLSWAPAAEPAPVPAPVPAAGPGSGPGGGGPDGAAVLPVIGKATLSPRAFRAAPRGPSALVANRAYGTKVTYTLNIAASVSFTVAQSRPGRKGRGGRCVRITDATRGAPRCTRLVALRGRFTRAGESGANSFRFTGRLAGHRLPLGNYQLVASPVTAQQHRRVAKVLFQIIR